MGSALTSPKCCSRHRKVLSLETMESKSEKIGKPKSIGLQVEPFRLPLSRRGEITAVDLYNSLTDGSKFSWYLHDPLHILLLDTRILQEYRANHILGAAHCTVISSSLISQNISEFSRIVLYDTDSKLDISDESSRALKLLHDHDADFEILCGGFSEFFDRFPFMCNATVPGWSYEQRLQQLKPIYPSLILEDWLYQGSGDQAVNDQIVNDIGITHILNISTEYECALPNIQYLALKLKDDGSSRLIEHFEEIFEFLDCARRTKGKALVHCNLGVSRSSTATLSYIMLSERCSLLDAWHVIHWRRPSCAPNLSFFLQLGQFEEYIFGKSLTNANELWLVI